MKPNILIENVDNYKNIGSGVKMTKTDVFTIAVLILLVLVTRVPFSSPVLIEGDSVNFALAMERYDVSQFRPHPPGYLFYIGMAKGFNLLITNANSSLVAVSVFFSLLTVVFLFRLTQEMFSYEAAVIASSTFIFLPYFWFYGEVALSYSTSACLGTMIAFCTYRIFIELKKERWIYLASFMLGLSGGVRQDLLFFLFPLVLYGVVKNSREWKIRSIALALMFIGISTWYFPTIYLSGGYNKYSLATEDQFWYYVAKSSILFGNPLLDHVKMIKDFILSFVGAASFPLVYLIIYFISLKSAILSKIRDNRFIFLMIWSLPSILFFILIFHQRGYILTPLPVLYVALGQIILTLTKKYFKKHSVRFALAIQITLITLINFSLFFSKPPSYVSDSLRKPLEEKTYKEVAASMYYNLLFAHTYNTIEQISLTTENQIKAIKKLPYSPDKVAMIIFHRSTLSYGLSLYYLPEYRGYFIPDFRPEVDKIRSWYRHELIDELQSKTIYFQPWEKIVVFTDEDSPTYKILTSQVAMKKISVDSKNSFYLIEQHPVSIRYKNIFFTTNL